MNFAPNFGTWPVVDVREPPPQPVRPRPRRNASFREAYLEIIPLQGVEAKLAGVPPGSTVTVTASPRFGLERTLDYSVRLVAAGYRAVPHLAARQVVDHADLRRIARRLRDGGVTDAFVIAGDSASPAGAYSSSLQLLEDLRALDGAPDSVGVACYPEGHPLLSEAELLEALQAKSAYADYMVSQLCFNADAFVRWVRRAREGGVGIPLHLGLAGPLKVRRLAELSMRLGAASSARYLVKQHGFLGHLVAGRSFEPERMVYEVAGDPAYPQLGIERVHLFSFNQIGLALDWQRRVGGGEGW